MKSIDMKFTDVDDLFVIEIENLFAEDIMKELEIFLESIDITKIHFHPEATGSSTSGFASEENGLDHGTLQIQNTAPKTSSTAWIHEICNPNVWKAPQSIHNTFQALIPQLAERHWIFKKFYSASAGAPAHLLSYYGHKDCYPDHSDTSFVTFLYWYAKDESKFQSEFLIGENKDVSIEFKSNKLVIFPSWLPHEVPPLEGPTKEEWEQGYGRWCWSTFFI